MADAGDLNSLGRSPCGFKSRLRHHFFGGAALDAHSSQAEIVARLVHRVQRNRRAASLQPSRHRVRRPHPGPHRQGSRGGGHGALRFTVGRHRQHGPGQLLSTRQTGPNPALAGALDVHGPQLHGDIGKSLREGLERPGSETLVDVRGVYHVRAGGRRRSSGAGGASFVAGDGRRSAAVRGGAGSPPGAAARTRDRFLESLLDKPPRRDDADWAMRSWFAVSGRMRVAAVAALVFILAAGVSAYAQSVGPFYRHEDPRYWWYESYDRSFEIALPANPIYTVHRDLFGETTVEIPMREGGPYLWIKIFPGGQAALNRAVSAVQQQWQHVLTGTR